MVCGAGAGAERVKILKLLRVRGGTGLNFAGAGRVRTQNFNPCRTLLSMPVVQVFFGSALTIFALA